MPPSRVPSRQSTQSLDSLEGLPAQLRSLPKFASTSADFGFSTRRRVEARLKQLTAPEEGREGSTSKVASPQEDTNSVQSRIDKGKARAVEYGVVVCIHISMNNALLICLIPRRKITLSISNRQQMVIKVLYVMCPCSGSGYRLIF